MNPFWVNVCRPLLFAKDFKQHIEAARLDTNNVSLADQIIDQMFSEDTTRYGVLFEIMNSKLGQELRRDKGDYERMVGKFISLWAKLESTLRTMASDNGAFNRGSLMTLTDELAALDLIPEGVRGEVRHYAEFRNGIVHEARVFNIETLERACQDMELTLKALPREDEGE
ncbi:MAG: hypothetical protein EOO38_25510 [Cytophagaceae bacterium]|nr:MAG: hypothetical protein EOO38_25510 [Cytophagaceae bacterium]